ncbi:acyltransferase family protein [Marinicella meishanensis]|uniref:acyltransferase family protein n=1 Tax=Marinicella meishanensis TaxID=2873263 RepID=UPI001CC0B267|nr:acyltransferase [Marinicella sp. NBU2979]
MQQTAEGGRQKFAWVQYLKIGTQPGRIPELDGLRALAIVMVLLYHFATYYGEVNGSYYRNFFTGALGHFLQNGWLGVDLFFVLSGYLIFHHLIKLQDQTALATDYRRYALKRVLRTFPVYYAMILLFMLGAIPYYKVDVTGTQLLTHLFFLQDYMGPRILEPMWSLATEEKFYLLAPLLLFLRRWPAKQATLLLLLFVLLMLLYRSVLIIQADADLRSNDFFIELRLPFHFAVTGILIGVLVALWQGRPVNRLGPGSTIGVMLILGVLLFSVKLFDLPSWHWTNWLHGLVIVLFGCLVWSVVQFSGHRWLALLRGRTLRVIAVLSYSLYLVHYALLPWVVRIHKTYIRSEEAWIHIGSFMALYLGMTLLGSLLVHYLVEKPFLIWKDRL